MAPEHEPTPLNANPRASGRPDHFNPVTVRSYEAIGTFFLGVLSVILLVNWIRTERRVQELSRQLGSVEEIG